MKRRHHCKTSQAKVMLAVLALCGVTAFWGSAVWASDAGQDAAPVQNGNHYFSVNPEDGNRDNNYDNDGAGSIPWPSEPEPMQTGKWVPRHWATMP